LFAYKFLTLVSRGNVVYWFIDTTIWVMILKACIDHIPKGPNVSLVLWYLLYYPDYYSTILQWVYRNIIAHMVVKLRAGTGVPDIFSAMGIFHQTSPLHFILRTRQGKLIRVILQYRRMLR